MKEILGKLFLFKSILVSEDKLLLCEHRHPDQGNVKSLKNSINTQDMDCKKMQLNANKTMPKYSPLNLIIAVPCELSVFTSRNPQRPRL